MMTENEAKQVALSLSIPAGYTAGYAYDDDYNVYVLVYGPNGWTCSFSYASSAEWAQQQIDEHAAS